MKEDDEQRVVYGLSTIHVHVVFSTERLTPVTPTN